MAKLVNGQKKAEREVPSEMFLGARLMLPTEELQKVSTGSLSASQIAAVYRQPPTLTCALSVEAEASAVI